MRTPPFWDMMPQYWVFGLWVTQLHGVIFHKKQFLTASLKTSGHNHVFAKCCLWTFQLFKMSYQLHVFYTMFQKCK